MLHHRLCDNLGLPKGDAFMQDWAYELPEAYRTPAWLERYIQSYRTDAYTKDEKNALMELMLDVANDLLNAGSADELIEEVLAMLARNASDHRSLIEYWALESEPLEYCFALTPRIREIQSAIGAKESKSGK